MRHDPPRLHRRRGQPLVDHPLRHHDAFLLGLGEGLVYGAVVDRLQIGGHAGAARQGVHREVVLEVSVNLRWLPVHGLLGIDHRRQHLVVNDDSVGRIPRQVAIGRHYHGHRFTHIADRVHGHGMVIG